jgi:hypothetical protein
MTETKHDTTTESTNKQIVHNDQQLQRRGQTIDTRPHRDPAILRYLRHDELLSYADAATKIEDTFGYDCSDSMVYNAVETHDIRDPITDGPFADLFEGEYDDGTNTEPAQPPSFFIDRSDTNPTNPLDTSNHDMTIVFDKPNEGDGGDRNDESSTTPHFTPPSNPQSTSTGPDTEESPSDIEMGVLKPPNEKLSCDPHQYRVDVDDREASLVAPPYAVRDSDYPDIYKACGCGTCERSHFLDGDDMGTIDCPTPVPVTIAGARRIYRHAEGGVYADGKAGNDVQRAEQQYARLMKADSMAFRAAMDADNYAESFINTSKPANTTTALVSLRVSPRDAAGRLLTPYTLIRDLKDAWHETREQLPHEGRKAYFWTFAGTDEWGTVHVHWYGYYDDPEDTLTHSQFIPAVESFCEYSTFADRDAHFKSPATDVENGPPLNDGTVRIEHDPLLVDPTRLQQRTDDTATGAFKDIIDDPRERLDNGFVQSRGAVYVGSQLPGLALRGAESDADVETAAFLDVDTDPRHTSHGDRTFYQLSDVCDVYVENTAGG